MVSICETVLQLNSTYPKNIGTHCVETLSHDVEKFLQKIYRIVYSLAK
jgi:hypothetical protein